MLTQEDVKKIIAAQKKVFATKEDLDSFQEEMIKSFSNQQIAVDKYAKKSRYLFSRNG